MADSRFTQFTSLRAIFSRYHHILALSVMMVTLLGLTYGGSGDPAAHSLARIPVILDTDIGDDIDDSWALVMLLKNPRIDIKLITTTHFKSRYRATLIAKYLTIAGRTDIPVGLGTDGPLNKDERMAIWIENFKLEDFKGKVMQEGAQAVVDTINESPIPITVIAIGPLNTLGAALKKDPSIAAKASFIGMDGSVHLGYGGVATPSCEFNVFEDIPDAKTVLSAPWKSIAITPLDTCSLVGLSGKRILKLKQSDDKLLHALIESHMVHQKITDPANFTNNGICFDSVAAYMADSDENHRFLNYEKLRIAVDNNGLTVISPTGREMDVATTWKDKDGFHDYMVKALLRPTP